MDKYLIQPLPLMNVVIQEPIFISLFMNIPIILMYLCVCDEKRIMTYEYECCFFFSCNVWACLIRSVSVKTRHEPKIAIVCSCWGVLHIDRKSETFKFLNLLLWLCIKDKNATILASIWLDQSPSLETLDAFGDDSASSGVMELNKTVLHFLEICPHWGLVWRYEWCNSYPRVSTTQWKWKVLVFCL